MNIRSRSVLVNLAQCLAYLLSTHAFLAAATETGNHWTDTGATFRAGTLGDSGQNLYVNRRGELETIRRYDLDGNGHLDLVFNSTHDTYNAPADAPVARQRRHQLRRR